MAKLNGWKRLGIVASFAWIIGAGAYGFNSQMNANLQIAQSLRIPCENPVSGLTPEQYAQMERECDKSASDWIEKSYHYNWEAAAIFAFVPVPFGWGFAYFLFFLVRWVKQGFIHSP